MREMYLIYQVISNTGFESPCSTKGGELPLLTFGNPIGPSTLLRMVSLPFEGLRAVSLSNRSNHFVPASRGGVTLESIK